MEKDTETQKQIGTHSLDSSPLLSPLEKSRVLLPSCRLDSAKSCSTLASMPFQTASIKLLAQSEVHAKARIVLFRKRNGTALLREMATWSGKSGGHAYQ
jgi:hypothetical protein